MLQTIQSLKSNAGSGQQLASDDLGAFAIFGAALSVGPPSRGDDGPCRPQNLVPNFTFAVQAYPFLLVPWHVARGTGGVVARSAPVHAVREQPRGVGRTADLGGPLIGEIRFGGGDLGSRESTGGGRVSRSPFVFPAR